MFHMNMWGIHINLTTSALPATDQEGEGQGYRGQGGKGMGEVLSLGRRRMTGSEGCPRLVL
jgi:hypothetical protein